MNHASETRPLAKRGRAEILAWVALVVMVLGVPVAAYTYESLREAARPPGDVFVAVRTVEHGGFSPERVVVKRGQRVRLTVRAEDVTHGFELLHFGVDAGAIKTGTQRIIEFTADRVGEFPFYCSVRCSPLHMGLMGTLVVEP